MSEHPTNFVGDVNAAIRTCVEAAIAGAKCESQGGGGHFTITVTAAAFEGQSLLAQQRMVLTSIAHLMKGEGAPVHAVDTLITKKA